MQEFPRDPPDLIFRVPLENVDIDARTIGEIQKSFWHDRLHVKLSAEDVHPCSGSWAELVIEALAFFAGGAATHYIDRVLDAFDKFARRTITHLDLNISAPRGMSLVHGNFPIHDENRDAARKILRDAFFEISVGLERENAVIFRLEDAKIDGEKTIRIVSSYWTNGEFGGNIKEYRVDNPDWGFWQWVLNVRKIRRLITDVEEQELRKQYASELKT